jgi:hypothetical protein
MPTWSKAALRTVGALDLFLSLAGFFLLFDPGYYLVSNPEFFKLGSDGAPYSRIAFLTMMVTNAVFLLLFAWASVQLLRLRRAGVALHTICSTLLASYHLGVTAFWVAGGRLGISVAAASTIANLGISPFQGFDPAPPVLVPYIFPVASTVLLLFAGRNIAIASQTP